MEVHGLVPAIHGLVFVFGKRAGDVLSNFSVTTLKVASCQCYRAGVVIIRNHYPYRNGSFSIALKSWIFALLARFDGGSTVDIASRRFANILVRDSDREGLPNRKFLGIFYFAEANPCSLINMHSLSHEISLPKRNSESHHGDEHRSDSSIENFVFKKGEKKLGILVCLCHVIFGFMVGMFLTAGLVYSSLNQRWTRSLLCFAFAAVSAAHVVGNLFQLVDAIKL